MAPSTKKRLVVSLKNMTPELQEEVKAAYPAGFADYMMRIPKPNGEFFFAVPFETNEISYLVKIDVRSTTLRTRRRIEITTTTT